jgi:poly(R)-hydroxyalkanoic acid synthase, class II
MREKQESGSVPVPAEFMSAQSAIVGLRGKDLLTTVRSLAVHGLRQPLHSARHLVAFGGQLGKVLLGDTLHQPNPQDARFQDPSWRLNPFYRRTLQAYLAWQKQLLAWIDESNLDCDDRARARFLVALLSDAVAPSNSLINPLAVKELFNTGGISLLNGVRHLLEDLVHNGGMPSQVNKTAFEIGRNLATTQGAVVFRNEVLELIQYKPLGERQYAKPLLIVPPQINKYYIFDLSPEKSFVQYALKNNLQVFVISWRNPDAQHREWGLSTYVEALDQAIEVSREITGSRSVNLAGACAGGLTVAALLGHLQVRRQLRKVSSVTYLVSLLDSQMESPAMLFADEQTLESSKRRSYQHGVLDGRDMAKVFAWMRPNDLIWNYWVNNYLLGNQPPAFDILYWNNDTTRLPAALHGEFVELFKSNPLNRPGALEVSGTPIDLKQVTCDFYCVAGLNDHITPWESCYKSARLLGGKCEFILSNSGHIQSILNPPGNPKARFMTNPELPAEPKAWLEQAGKHADSWWLHWQQWLAERSGKTRKAPASLGNKTYPAGEAAPGTYVHER